MKKKILVILFCSFFSLISCESDTISIYQPNFTEDKIDFPFTEIEDGRFSVIYRNNTKEIIPYSLIMLQNNIEDSQNQDYCEGVNALRNGKNVKEWTPINDNYSVMIENPALDDSDHPNGVSYNLPKGTYLLMIQDSEICNRDNHVIFDVKGNKAFETSK